MASESAKKQQYEYRINSNLVIQADRSLMDKRYKDEPTGEVQSLVGRLGNAKMGDRYERTNLSEFYNPEKREKKEKTDTYDEISYDQTQKKSKIDENEIYDDMIGVVYRPRTTETKRTYDVLLNFIQGTLGDQPRDILRGAADEILAVLKDEIMKDNDKRKEITSLIGKLSDERYAMLLGLGKKITDYELENEINIDDDIIADNYGVTVRLDDDDEINDNEEYKEVVDIGDDQNDNEQSQEEEMEQFKNQKFESHEEEIDGTTTVIASGIKSVIGGKQQIMEKYQNKKQDTQLENVIQANLANKNDLLVKTDSDILNVWEIDAYWLQRELNKFYNNAEKSHQQAEQILIALKTSGDDRDLENRLMLLLGHDKFSLIKTIRKNKNAILYCTLLAAAQNEEEKKEIEKIMKHKPELREILNDLNAGKDSDLLKEERDRKLADRKTKLSNVFDENGLDENTRHMIDLESLAFKEGSHLMTNKKCVLPQGSLRKQKKGYEEVYIPSSKAPVLESERLVAVKDLPDYCQNAFSGYQSLNRIQSKICDAALNKSENLLICAPTGAGKTNVALLTMLREIENFYDKETGKIKGDDLKMIYIAPMKSLVQEMVLNFSKRLSKYGIVVSEMTGDHQLNRRQIESSHLIVCTPEKWDIVSRKSGEKAFIKFVSLVIIDEIHLLHDSRGPVLESLVARIIRHSESFKQPMRIIGLSATLPNYIDVADFIRVNTETGLFYFDNSYRPVPLQLEFIGLTEKKALKRFQLSNEIVYEKVMERAGKYQILVFVHSRKETVKTAKALRDMCLERETLGEFIVQGSASAEVIKSEAEQTLNQDLKDLLPFGFAVHHAGMNKIDRTLVEDLFADGHIQVLVSTATLAWGVNLPAHTVIIKGTQVYSPEKGKWSELGSLDVLQMLGRAGRPQYDTVGEGILITTHNELQYYLSLLNQQLFVESQMIEKLPDNLNAEIVAGTIRNIEDASRWLSYTYLYVRMMKNPGLYGSSISELKSDLLFQQRRLDLIHSAAVILDRHNLISYDRKTGMFQSTELGRIASHFYCSFDSISTYSKLLRPQLSEIELFRVFSLSNEFKYITVREEEKVELQQLLERVPIPIKESMEESSAKVNVLLQAYISQLKLDGFALMADMSYITQSAGRLFRALFEICLYKGWANLADKTLDLCKMIEKRMWLSMSPLRQFKKLPIEVIKKIEKKDFPWERFYDLEPSEIGELIHAPKMGKLLHKYIHHFPKLELSTQVLPISRSTLKIELVITPDFVWDESIHGYMEPFWLMVHDVDSEKILHYEYIFIKNKYANEDHIIKFYVPLFEPVSPHYFIKIVSDKWLHAETLLPVLFTKLTLPERNPPSTELLDLQPLPKSSLKNPIFEKLFDFSYFNPIQTQIFNAFYNSDESVFLGAPPGSGKTTTAELAIMRFIAKMSNDKCVYMTPSSEQADYIFNLYKEKYEKSIGIPIVKLTGDTSLDIKLLASGSIIISVSEYWDAISRRWKQRKNVQAVSLLICDDTHLIGGVNGPTIEVSLSRMRYMASQLEKKIRLVIISSSISNAKEVSQWLGISVTNTFNFHPNSRPIPLQLHIQGFPMANATTRRIAMMQHIIYSVCSQLTNQNTLVYVSTRKEAISIAYDLHLLLLSSKNEIKDEEMEKINLHITDKLNKDLIKTGIVYIHETMLERDVMIIQDLLKMGVIKTIIATKQTCWKLTCQFYHVIVMDTQYYDGKIHSYTDYSITDILKMMGRAARPLKDDIAKITILCESSKREFFKKFLSEPLPIESHLDQCLHDHFCAEVVTKTIENKQDAVDYLTWTFLYRRMTQNPNYYGLQGVTHRYLSDHLSELVENTLNNLCESKCIIIEDDMDTIPMNLGMISVYYYINYFTIELFGASLTANTKERGLLEIISSAVEFDEIPIRHKEELYLKKASLAVPFKIPSNSKFNDPHIKVNILLQQYLSRQIINNELFNDTQIIITKALKLIQACVDVFSSNGWLLPALCAMEFCQMITQALWNKDSHLYQIPHFDKEIVERCIKNNITHIFDLTEMEDNERIKLLDLPNSKMIDVANFCNEFPYIELNYEIKTNYIIQNSPIILNITLTRDNDQSTNVISSYFPYEKQQSWWIIVGILEKNQ